MKIAVATPTGHVGSAVVDFLLEFGGGIRVTLLGRRPTKLRDFVRRGAEMAVGSQDDADYLTKATYGSDALFWVTPPGYGSDNVRAFQNRLGQAAARAIRANGISRVVNLSSIGAESASGVGPINGLHDVEGLLDEASTNITHLRPGFFFENLLWQLDSIRRSNKISLPISGSRRFPMIATRDIGRFAAARLASRGWMGHFVSELHGPADLSFDEVAGVLSETLGRKITHTKCSPSDARRAMIDSAMSENAADVMIELYDAVETGRLRPLEPRSPQNTTSTTLAEFARRPTAASCPPRGAIVCNEGTAPIFVARRQKNGTVPLRTRSVRDASATIAPLSQWERGRCVMISSRRLTAYRPITISCRALSRSTPSVCRASSASVWRSARMWIVR